jgi:hypothetical protein
MNLIQRLLGRRPPSAAPATVPPTGPTPRDATRQELLSMAVRDTLRRHGIPQAWIAAQVTPALTARKERGSHLRLVARHWHPALASCVVALQKSVLARLNRLDPLSGEWLVGVSWKFDPADDTLCPALPAPEYWQQLQQQQAPAAQRPSAARDALHRLMAESDHAFAARGSDGFSATQPMLPA